MEVTTVNTKTTGKKIFGSGLVGVAHGVRLADVDVIASFPIRPYTGVMIELARMVADGELDAEFLHAEGEHGQLSIAYGASAAGARTFVGSSGVGVTYAFETYSPASGGRLPVQCLIADRTLDPPGDFGSEHTDALTARDQCWLMGWAETPQEALDMTLLYYRVGEDRRVMLPQFPCQEGYFVSHIPGDIVVPEQEQVNEFLPPFQPINSLDPAKPVIMGPQAAADMGSVLQLDRREGMTNAYGVIREATDEFNRIFGRNYAPFVEEYMTDDAEAVFLLMGAHTWVARAAVRDLRKQGEKVGLVKLRFFRPFPTEDLQQILQKFKVVGVIDTNSAFGISVGGGVLLTEVRAALYEQPTRPRIIGFVAGLAGDVVTHEDFYSMAKVMLNVLKTGKIEREAYWVPFDLEEQE
jgi:oxalate oxidoreductase subunit alpha